MTLCIWRDSFIHAMTHSYVWRTHSYVPWLIRMCDVTHPYMPWLILMCDVTRPYMPRRIHMWHAVTTWLICIYIKLVDVVEIREYWIYAYVFSTFPFSCGVGARRHRAPPMRPSRRVRTRQWRLFHKFFGSKVFFNRFKFNCAHSTPLYRCLHYILCRCFDYSSRLSWWGLEPKPYSINVSIFKRPAHCTTSYETWLISYVTCHMGWLRLVGSI